MNSVHPHRLVLGVADAMAAAHLRRQISQHPRFELAGVADNAVKTLFLVEQEQPAVAVVADDSPGIRGRDVLADIAAASPDTLVIITTPGDPSALIGKPAVAESVHQHDLDAVQVALDNLAAFLDDPGAEEGPDRRHAVDRRFRQDWSQVFAERRVSARRIMARRD